MKTLINRYYYSLADLTEHDSPVASPMVTFDYMLNGIAPLWAGGSMLAAEQKMFQDYLWPEFYEAPIFFYDVECNPWLHEDGDEPDLDDVIEAAYPLLGRFHRWYEESKERYIYLITQLESIKATLLGPVKVVSAASGSYSGTVTGSGTNTGTVQVGESNNTTTTVASSTVRKESDTPQDGIQSLLDGYLSRAAQETGNSTTTLAGSGTTTTTNNLANSNSSTNSGSNTENSTVSNDFNTPIERFREIQEKLRNLYADWANEFSKFVLHSAE